MTAAAAAKYNGRFGFDIESNGLLDKIDRIHCLVLRCMDTGEVQSFDSENDDILDGLQILADANEVCGHNIIGYDLPAIQIVYPDFKLRNPDVVVTDTLVLSRLIHADLFNEDAAKQPSGLQKRQWGSHGLAAWGLRLGNLKGDYKGGWELFSQEMLEYCVQDVEVTAALYKKLMATNPSEVAVDLEHQLAEICLRIGNAGWTFDSKLAGELYAELATKRHELQQELDTLFPPWEVVDIFIPKRDNKTLGYIKDEPFEKKKLVEFNPTSRRHIERCLREKYKWKPTKFTADGHAQIDEVVLGELVRFPEAQKLASMFLLQKRIGQIAEGPQAWLKKVSKDGRIRHTIISGGTISGRASHRGPNLAQVPKPSLMYGEKCRSLFTVPDGWFLCGADLSGLELRCLAHYLKDHLFTEQLLEGDIHTYNAHAFKVDRNTAKTLIYAMNYGGGDALVGQIAGGDAKLGKKLKRNFDREVPSFARLKEGITKAYKRRGYLFGLDGRRLAIRSEHKCLSQLLQSAGAILCKKWVALIDHEIHQEQIMTGHVEILGWIHDEVQIGCRTEELANHVGNIARRMAKEAGAAFQTGITIDADFSVGRTWSDTH